MARRKHMLHVRQHLEHLQLTLEALQQHGLVPVVQHELAVLGLVNKAILRKAQERARSGNRKDLRVEAPNVDTRGA